MNSFFGTPFDDRLPQIGKIWRNYKIIREIARGGMGIVYEAIQATPNRRVAIKIIQEQNIGTHFKRFEREIQIAAKLSHPNIAGVHSVERDEQFLALIMEYVEGYSFCTYFKKENISFADKLKMFVNICKALKYAHDKDIIHRDLKPVNIMITTDEQVKLIDFGLARQVNQRFDLTKTGDILGTPKYMAPEQIIGTRKNIDKQTDIYAMGTILYEMMTLKEMIMGLSSYEILFNIAHQKIVSPKSLNNEVDKNLEKIWKMATARNKKERYQNIDDMIYDLENYLSGKSVRRNLSKKMYYLLAAIVSILSIFTYIFTYYNIPNDKLEFAQLQEIKLTPQERAIFNFIDAKDFVKAIQEYEKNPELRNNSFLQKQIANSYYEIRNIGIDKLHSGKMLEARVFFEILSKKFSTDPEIIFFLAKTYFPIEEYYAEKYPQNSNELENAKTLLESCIKIDPYNSKYFFLLGKIFYSLNKHEDACLNIQHSLELDNENLEALEILCKIPYEEPTLQKECYQYIVSIIADFSQFKKVNLFAPELKSIENKHLEDYLYYISLIKTDLQEQKMLETLSNLDDLAKNQNLSDTILAFRYHENFEENLNKFIINSKNKVYLTEIRDKAQSMQSQEYLNFCYYLLAYMFHHQNWRHPILEEVKKKEEFKKKLQQIISSEQENCFIVFLSVRAYVELFGFSYFMSATKNETLPHKNQIIVTAVLRNMYFPLDIKKYYQYKNITNITTLEQSFLEYLIADTIQVYERSLTVDTFGRTIRNKRIVVEKFEITLLEEMTNSNDDRVKVSALMALFHLKSASFLNKNDIEIIRESKQLAQHIKANLKNNNALIKSYIHNRFWLNKYIQQHVKDYTEMYVEGLIDQDSQVKKNTILFYGSAIPILESPTVVKALKGILEHEKDKIVRFHAISAYVRSNNLGYETLKKSLYHSNCSDFEKLYANVFYLYNKINYLAQPQIVIETVTKYRSDVRESKNIYFQLFSLYFFSLLGYHDIDINKINNKGMENLLYQLHGEANIKISSKIHFDFLSLIFEKAKCEKRFLFAKKYLDKNEKLQKYALSACIALQENEQEKEKIFQQYRNKPSLKKAIALGYYRSLVREVQLRTEKYFRNIIETAPKEIYFNYTNELISFLQRDTAKLDLYESWLEKARVLDPQQSKYYFELAMIFFIQQKKGKALRFIDKAIEKEPGNYLYYYYKAKISPARMHQDIVVNLQKAEKLMPHYFLLQQIGTIYLKLNEYEKAEDVFHKMFLQNAFENPVKYLGLVEAYLEMGKKEEAMTFLYCISEVYKRQDYALSIQHNIPQQTFRPYIATHPKLQKVVNEFYQKYYQ